jgi:hypothetical protein
MTRTERRSFWYRHFEAWAGGAESQAAYCRRFGLSPMTFCQWKRRFERQRLNAAVAGGEENGSALVQVHVAEEAPPDADSGVTVTIDARLRLELARDFDAATLQRAVAALTDAGH